MFLNLDSTIHPRPSDHGKESIVVRFQFFFASIDNSGKDRSCKDHDHDSVYSSTRTSAR